MIAIRTLSTGGERRTPHPRHGGAEASDKPGLESELRRSLHDSDKMVSVAEPQFPRLQREGERLGPGVAGILG